MTLLICITVTLITLIISVTSFKISKLSNKTDMMREETTQARLHNQRLEWNERIILAEAKTSGTSPPTN